jgi:hypothetical protein
MQEQIKNIIEKYRGDWNARQGRFDFPCFFKTEEAKKELKELLGDQVKIFDGDSGEMLPWIKLEGIEYDSNYRTAITDEVSRSTSV